LNKCVFKEGVWGGFCVDGVEIFKFFGGWKDFYF